MNPIRVLALAAILLAVCDAANGEPDAWAWLQSRCVGCICDRLGIEQAAVLRSVHERQATPVRERRRYRGE